MKFLRNLLAVLVGLTIFTIGGFIILAILISATSTEQQVKIEDNSVLHFKISGIVAEREMDDPFAEIDMFGASVKNLGLKEMKQAIRHAAADEKIKGIYLEPGFFDAGYSSLEEIRNELIQFKESGKFILAFSESYTEKGYYLASVADDIYLPPGFGGIEFNGLSAEVTFFKGTLDKLEVEPQIFRVGEFKSAVEPFIRKDMSPASRRQIESFINSFNDHVLAQIADSRGLEINYLRNVADSMLIRVGDDAIKYDLADKEVYASEMEGILKEKLGIDEEADIKLVSYRKYNKSFSDSKYSKDRIAVIIGEGAITSGKGSANSIGSDKYAALIKSARENDRVKAIVLRVNSPGGSALASDVMWNEIKLASKEKPVIASMSDVAASGGYYIAMGCNKIVAMPTTITGSIGIFGMIFNIEKLMENKLGITTDRVTTGHFSDIYTMTRPLSDYEKSIIQGSIDKGYETFTTKAAEGRGMSLDELLEVASGRVWSGIEAKEVGLIDEFGSLEDAITMAAEMAEVEEYTVRYYPEQQTVIEQLLEDLSNDVQTKWIKWQTGDLYPVISTIQELETYRGIQARMLFEFKID